MPLSQFQLFSKPNLFIIFMGSRCRNNETQQLLLRWETAYQGALSGTKGQKIQAQKDAFNKGQVLESGGYGRGFKVCGAEEKRLFDG